MCKKLLVTLVPIFLILFTASAVIAQSARLHLVVINYQSQEELKKIFAQDGQVLYYTSDDQASLALVLVSSQSLEKLFLLGFKPEIIDKEADLNNYLLLYSRVEFEASNLAPLGQVYPLTANYTLLKTNNTAITRDQIPPNFQIVPFLLNISPPPYSAKTITPPPQVEQKTLGVTGKMIKIFIFSIICTVILTIAVSYYYKKVKKEK